MHITRFGLQGDVRAEFREMEREDTVSPYLQCVRGRPLSPFHGGQQLVVALGGRSAHQQRRAYAISSSPLDLSNYRITVHRMVAPEPTMPDGYVSSYLNSIKVGEHVLCTAPFGAQKPVMEQADNIGIPVMLSQGLGIAPMLSLLYELEGLQTRAVYIFHEPTDFEPQRLLRETRELMARNPGFQMIQVSPHQINAELIRHHVPLEQASIHIAGTSSFVDRLTNEFRAAGLSTLAMMVQSFG